MNKRHNSLAIIKIPPQTSTKKPSTIMSKLLILFLLISPLLQADDFHHLSGASTDPKIDRLNFTNTQKWNPIFTQLAQQRPKILTRDWTRQITLPAPPPTLPEITKEIEITAFRFGTHTYQSLTTSKSHQATGKLLTAAYHDLGIATFVLKKKFNRVRPSLIQKDLGHAITIPSHPAYPSGHATGAYVIAYILQELDPSSAKTYLKDAHRISQNREIAGLHYPSDTTAGRLLARQLVDQFLTNPTFKKLLQQAKSEWP